MQTTAQTLPTNAQTLKDWFDKEFTSMQRQYRRHITDWKTFSEPENLPNADITLHHLYNICTYVYPNDKASKELLLKLPPLPQFQNTKSNVVDEMKPPSATIQKRTILMEDKENVLNEKLRGLKDDVEAKNRKIKELNEAHIGEIKTYTQKITQLENDRDTAHKVAKERQDTITRLQSDIQTLRVAKESADNQLQTVQTSQTSIKETIQTLQTRHDDKMSASSKAHKLEMSALSEKHAADIADIEKLHRQELSDLENSKKTEGVALRADIADKEKLIAELQTRLNKGLLKYRKPTKLEMINIISNGVAAVGFYQIGGIYMFTIWCLMALFFWDTLLTIKDSKNKKSGEYGFYVSVAIEIVYGCIHPTTITNAVKNTPNLIIEAEYYGYIGAAVLTIMSIISLNQSMNKAQDKAKA